MASRLICNMKVRWLRYYFSRLTYQLCFHIGVFCFFFAVLKNHLLTSINTVYRFSADLICCQYKQRRPQCPHCTSLLPIWASVIKWYVSTSTWLNKDNNKKPRQRMHHSGTCLLCDTCKQGIHADVVSYLEGRALHSPCLSVSVPQSRASSPG